MGAGGWGYRIIVFVFSRVGFNSCMGGFVLGVDEECLQASYFAKRLGLTFYASVDGALPTRANRALYVRGLYYLPPVLPIHRAPMLVS